MLSQTFSFRGATVTIKRENVRSRLLGGMVYRHFNINEDMDEAEFTLIRSFVKFLTQTEVAGDMGFTVPPVSAESKVILNAFEQFMDLPGEFCDAYLPALAEVDAVVGDPDVTPDASEKKVSTKEQS